METLRGLDQNFECAEKHLEFAIENNHEILEKLDYIGDDSSRSELMNLTYKVNVALRQVYTRILEFKQEIKRLLQESDNAEDRSVVNFLIKIQHDISILRKKLRISRKAYQQIKEFCLEKKLDAPDDQKIFWDALIGEVADGRGNIYAAERHLTEIAIDVEGRIKQLKEKTAQKK